MLTMVNEIVILLLFFQICFCSDDINKNYVFQRRSRNSYYFKLGKHNNEIKVNNKIYFLNHNITNLDYPNGRVENMKKVEEKHSVHVSIYRYFDFV